MEKQFPGPGEIHKREMIMLPRNEERHREAIIYLLDLLKSHDISILDESLKDYLEERFFGTELNEEKDMNIWMENQQVHRSVISFLQDLLQLNNIDIPDEKLKDYLENLMEYDCMWEDYRKESGENGNI